MATTYGSWIATAGSSGNRILRPYITYNYTNTESNYRIDWTAGVQVGNGASASSAVVNYKITCTNRTYAYEGDDGGKKKTSSSLSPLYTNYYSFSKTTSSSSQTISFKMWTSHGSTTLTLSFTVPALNTYTLSYNANGGSGAPASQTLYYNTAGTVRSATPTRSGYAFQRWASTSAGGTPTYNPNSSITITSNKTLYAVWQATYTIPKVKTITAYRVADNATGQDPQLVNDGTRAYVKFTTDKGTNINSNGYLTNSTLKLNNSTASWSTNGPLTVNTTNSSINTYYGYIDNLDNDSTFNISITVTVTTTQNNSATFTAGTFISAEVYIIDISADGKRISFGHKASDDTGDRSRFKVEINNTELDDWIIESGTFSSDSTPPWYWNYKKYADGTFEAWCHSNNTYTTPNGLAGAYDSSSKYVWYRSNERSMTINSRIGASQVLYANINVADMAGTFTSVTNYSGTQVTYYINCSQQITTARNCYITAYFFGTY